MRRKTVRFIVLFAATSSLLFYSGLSTVWAQQKGKPIVVGAPIPRASAYGQNGERGMILATEEINAGGGVRLGNEMLPFQLEIIDTRDEEPGVPTSEVLLALEKLILQKKVDMVAGGPCMSECGLAPLIFTPSTRFSMSSPSAATRQVGTK
jgi:branched-chain amino acid transport system substrate-binding protein